KKDDKPKAKRFVNPYLAHAEADDGGGDPKDGKNKGRRKSKKDGGGEEAVLLDSRLAGGHVAKTRHRSRPINFVAPGTYVALGEKKREAAARAEESGYLSGRKAGNVVRSVGMGGAEAEAESNNIADNLAEGTTEGGGGHYGAAEAGRLLPDLFPARADAPEVELEDHALKKKILTSIGDVDLELNDEAVAAASEAASGGSHAVRHGVVGRGAAPVEAQEGAGRRGGTEPGPPDEEQAGRPAGQEDGGGGRGRHGRRAARGPGRTAVRPRGPVLPARVAGALPDVVPRAASRAGPHAGAEGRPRRGQGEGPDAPPHEGRAEAAPEAPPRRAPEGAAGPPGRRAGAPPEPRLTLSNYMKVLGDQAVLDPSKMESRVMEQIQARKMKHEKMNADRKLTREQRAAKHRRKLAEDTSTGVHVALFWVADMGHPYHRAKVDLNAGQNSITGGVLECAEAVNGTRVNLVVAEGGERAIKRYVRLMTVRMRWRGEDFYEDDEGEEEGEGGRGGVNAGEEDFERLDDVDGPPADGDDGDGEEKKERRRFNPDNECRLLWTGMAMKRSFASFMFQSAATPTLARRVMEAKGVPHYWDRAAAYAEGRGGTGGEGGDGGGGLGFRLG
ncbi:hypothetical protein THAOC_15935, partial [Thalassiosira oceanica]